MNGDIMPVDKMGWILVVDSSDYAVKYKIVNSIVYVYMKAKRASAVPSSDWGTMATLPITPDVPIYICPYYYNSYYTNYCIDLNGKVQVIGNAYTGVAAVLSFPLPS